ncbi:MAG: RDD family protein [Acidimicrobiia bacterium]|nr:RDD family protein [Acidimicrobiia bacterium]
MTRLAAVAADTFGVFTLGTTLASVLLFLLGQITDTDPSAVATGVTTLVAVTALFLTWFWLPVALFGRTPAMALLGVAVVRRDGGVAGSTRALVRALVLPVSMVVPILFLSAVLGRERRTLHDLVAGTAVVYDWGAREAEQPATVRQQLSARVRRSQVERAAG